MATNRLLDTRTTNFGELLGNGRRYTVPAFQRDYAWTEENWADLWQDIVTLRESQEPHFMGTIVTQLIDDGRVTFNGEDVTFQGSPVAFGSSYKIIDGQQRLTTLSILSIAIIQQLQALVDNGVDPDANRERQVILRRTYLGARDAGSLRYSSKLALNENNNGFYENNLINLRPPQNIRSLNNSEKLLWQSFKYFLSQIESDSKLSGSGVLLADFLGKTVAQQLMFIQIEIEDQTNAYVLFETLNSRGVELGTADLLKNHIFSLLKGPADHAAGRYEWQRIIRTVGMSAFPAFLKCYLSLSTRHVGQHRLFKVMRENVQDAEQSFALLSNLGDYSDLYAALGDADDDFWYRFPNRKLVRDLVRQLSLFNAEPMYPVLLAAFSKFDDGKFEKLLKMMAVVAFRYLIVSGLNANELEKQCNVLAIAISQGKVKSPKAAFDYLSALYVTDQKFQQDFSLLSIENHRQKGVVKYILRQLERDESGKDVPEDSFSIEHMLPQHPDENWRQAFAPTNPDKFVYRLGNLTPLEANLNSSLGRADFLRKRTVFAKSAYAITQKLQHDEWTANAIAFRQEEMAQQAVRIWKVDY